MSLVNLIKVNKPFRDAVKKMTRRPCVSELSDKFVEPKTKQHMLVGTAFDYLVGYTIEHLSHGKVRTKSSLVADRSLRILRAEGGDEFMLAAIRDAEIRLDMCKAHANVYVEDGRLTREFASSLIDISRLDALYRGGVYPRMPLARASKGDVDDLIEMHRIMPLERLSALESAYIGPDFGFSSEIVGGADADFVVDGSLLDTKTTMKKTITLSMWCQVVGYFLLNRIERYVGNPFINIDKVGIYFGRYGEICEIPVEDSITDPETLTLIMLGHPVKE